MPIRRHLPGDPARRRSRRRRGGAVLVYTTFAMTALLGVASLAVDWGYVQTTRTEMQRQADATARGYLAIYETYGMTAANHAGPSLYNTSAGLNPVDGASGVAPSVTVTWGYWHNEQFVPGSSPSHPTAVRVVVSRRKVSSNSLTMPIARAVGWADHDLTCAATAVLVQEQQSSTDFVPSTSDLWLAGMPAGSTASANSSGNLYDTTYNAPPYQASIPVTPGTYISFEYASGHSANGPTHTTVPADGNLGQILDHDQGAENGIANIRAPINCLLGLFLDDSAPNTSAAPAMRDYASAASRDQAVYDDIRLKQPFFIGDGVTSTGQSQRFLVPPGCTRIFLGTMDGHQWHNNVGGIETKTTANLTIELKE